jgi:hypothetical protein
VYQNPLGRKVEELVCRDDDAERNQQALADDEFERWVATQVRTLHKLGFQVADKGVARVLVELHNAGLLAAGLCVVGTLAYMCWLNELGARAVAARTLDLDLAAPRRLKLAAPRSLLDVIANSKMSFQPIPGLARKEPATSLKLPGASGLRIDILTDGAETGKSVRIAPLQWYAQTVEHYAYLLENARDAALLAGTHCIAVRIPDAERFMWHKLFSSAARRSFREKAAKDLRQGLTLAAVLLAQDEDALHLSAAQLPRAMRRALLQQWPAIRSASDGDARVRAALGQALGVTSRASGTSPT